MRGDEPLPTDPTANLPIKPETSVRPISEAPCPSARYRFAQAGQEIWLFPRDTTELHSARRFPTLLLAQPRVIAVSDADSTTLTLLSRWQQYYAIRPGIAPNVLEFYIIMPNKRSRPESSRPQAAGQWTGSGLFKPNPELEPQLARQRRVAMNRAKARLLRGLGPRHSECWLNRHGSDGVSARRTRRVPIVRLTTGGDRH
jgi:hypothetical protein